MDVSKDILKNQDETRNFQNSDLGTTNQLYSLDSNKSYVPYLSNTFYIPNYEGIKLKNNNLLYINRNCNSFQQNSPMYKEE